LHSPFRLPTSQPIATSPPRRSLPPPQDCPAHRSAPFAARQVELLDSQQRDSWPRAFCATSAAPPLARCSLLTPASSLCANSAPRTEPRAKRHLQFGFGHGAFGHGVWGGAPRGHGPQWARERAGRKNPARARCRCGCALLVGVGRAPRVPGAACVIMRACAGGMCPCACLPARGGRCAHTRLRMQWQPALPALPAGPAAPCPRARGAVPNAVEFWARVERARVGACFRRLCEW
jgi:hypothetical protein